MSDRHKYGGRGRDGESVRLAAGATVSELRSLSTGRAASLLRHVAEDLFEQADDIASTMVRAYEREIPAYAEIRDEALREDVHAVSSNLVRCWLTVMSTGEPVSTELLTPLLEGVRRRAAQGFDLQSLLRAYRVGIRVMWSEITGSAAWRGQALQGVAAEVGTWALDFADRIATAVAGAYLDETEQIAREREHRRSALLNVILSGPPSEPIDHPAELDERHAVVVVRVPPDLSLLELEHTGQLLEERAGAVLWTVRHRSVVAAVALPPGGGRDGLLRRLGRLVHEAPVAALGVGGHADGVAETRQSYAEAMSVLQIGPLLGSTGSPVYDFQELAPLIALLEHRERARRFAAGALEPLGGLRDRAWLLPTVESFIAHQGRMKPVAADLGVHLNTVKYRMREVRAVAERCLADADTATTLLLALRIVRVLEAEEAHRAGAAQRTGGRHETREAGSAGS